MYMYSEKRELMEMIRLLVEVLKSVLVVISS